MYLKIAIGPHCIAVSAVCSLKNQSNCNFILALITEFVCYAAIG